MKRKKIIHAILIVLLILLSIIYLIPIIMMVLGSLKTSSETLAFDLKLPSKVQWSNYLYVFAKGSILTGYFNSIVMSTCSTALVLLCGSLAGIYLGRVRTKTSNTVYLYFIMGLTLSFQIASTFALLKYTGLYGSRVAVILIYVGMNLPFTVMTFSSFIKGISREIDEAGIIDGCNILQLIFKILIPIMKPIMVTNLIVVAISTWNNFMVPLFYLNKSSKWTIPLMVYNFYGMYVRQWNYVFAMLVLTVLPVIIMYLCLQKYIVEGMTAGAVKG